MVRAWVVTLHLYHVYVSWAFQCPHGLELLLGLQLAASQQAQFQCPHGLELLRIGRWYCIIFYSVSMPSRAYTSFLHHECETISSDGSGCVNALSGLYLISTVPLQKPRFYAVSRACFCRYLSEYSDSSCFSCMLTFWTYLMRCTYPWHWIKYSTNYNRCHPIFFTLLISWAEQ